VNQPVDEYLEAEVQRLLTEHVDVAEQGITIVRRQQSLLLCGEVESPQRRDEILRLVAAHFPGVPVHCDIGLTRTHPPSDAEELN
jgi:hypothetical protein